MTDLHAELDRLVAEVAMRKMRLDEGHDMRDQGQAIITANINEWNSARNRLSAHVDKMVQTKVDAP